MGLFQCVATFCLCLALVLKTCTAGSPHIGQIYPGFEASAKEWSSNSGIFLLSNNSNFGLSFSHALNDTLFFLVVYHISSERGIWTANRGKLVEDSAKFVFDKSGNISLQWRNGVVWSPDTSGQKVASVELRDSGNLVLLGNSGSILWQSFRNPTDTLLPGQEFSKGMRLNSRLNKENMRHYLEIKSDDLVLYAGYQTPQTYWSLANESRKTNNSVGGKIHSAILESNSWNFYDQTKALLWKFIFSENTDGNATWALFLGPDGAIIFVDLQKGSTSVPEAIKIPQNFCSTPEACGRYLVCYFEDQCQCPASLDSSFNCKPPIASTCNSSRNSTELFFVGPKLDYFALAFVTPISNYTLDTCKEACLHNCSCLVLFFENHTGNCFLFDGIGGFERPPEGSAGYVSYMKVSSGNVGVNPRTEVGGRGRKHILSVVLITVSTVLVISGILYVGIWYYRRKRSVEIPQENFEEDHFSNNFSGMPVRFSYDDLCSATKSFSIKVGQGGFGSVYLGTLPDGTQLAVKKLERIGQGMKEFRAEVSIFGNVRHIHLVKLRGFCAEGPHRLLVYEYMENGSLDKWIFKINKENQFLSWDTRFNIALGTAKGLAYLHEECEVKIVHCDIKPENVLLDDNFNAKVSDFGLAKLMNREESLVYTTLRGTRGYLAPEWIKNSPISEKSDIYSYGMVLLEIIGGRKNYDSGDDSENAHFPSYAFKMLEEDKLSEIFDPRLDVNEKDERVVTAIKVALWCTQDEMHLRPPMTKVVQMLEGLCAVPQPPTPSQLNPRAYPAGIKWNSDYSDSSEPLYEKNSAPFSDAQLSGPR